MDVLYRIQGIEFEWDENKARDNIVKHGVTFEEAAEAFLDPFYREGDASVDGEQRDFILVHCYHSFCSPGPLWAAVKGNKFAVATVPHKGARLRN